MIVAPLYLPFIGNKGEVKIRTLISFERSCYSTGQLAKTKEEKPVNKRTLKSYKNRKRGRSAKDIEVLQKQWRTMKSCRAKDI